MCEMLEKSLVQRLEANDPTLVEIEVRDVDFREAILIVTALTGNSHLQSLELISKRIKADRVNVLVESLATSLATNTALTCLWLSLGRIGSDPVKVLADAVANNTTLEELSLPSNDLCKEGIGALSGMLKTTETLTHLSLAYNKIDLSGLLALTSALKVNSSLQSLNLKCCSGMDPSAFADALAENTSIVELNLIGNRIGSGGARALSKALKTNKTLKTLKLGENYLDMHAIDVLSSALDCNLTITEIDLCTIVHHAIGMEAEGLFDLRHWESRVDDFCRPKLHRMLENKNIQQEFLHATNKAPSLLPLVLARSDRVAMQYHCLRSRIDVVGCGLQGRPPAKNRRTDAATQRDECMSAPKQHEPTTIEEASIPEKASSSKSNTYAASKWLAYMLVVIALFATVGTRIVKRPNPRLGDACVER